MEVTIKISLDNAAFEDPSELSRILNKLADRIGNAVDQTEETEISLFDVNGNRVGEYGVTE
jgi:hypothetical protein